MKHLCFLAVALFFFLPVIGQSLDTSSNVLGIATNQVTYNTSIINEFIQIQLSSKDYQLALPEIFPKNTPTPESNFYYPIKKAIYPKYEELRKEYQQKIAELDGMESKLRNDTLILYYLHDFILFNEVLYKQRGRNISVFYDSTIYILNRQKTLANRLKYHRFELEAINRLELVEYARTNFHKALEYSLERIELYKNGLKDNCSSCNTIPKNYIIAAQYFLSLGEPENAMTFFEKAKEVSKLPMDKEYAYQHLAGYYLRIKNYIKALETINVVENDSAFRFKTFLSLKIKSAALAGLKKYNEALNYANKAIAAEKLYAQAKKQKFVKDSYDNLYVEIYLGLNQPFNALKYSNNASIIDRVRIFTEQEKVLQEQKLLAAKQKLEIEKLHFDNANKRVEAEVQKQILVNRLEKSRIQSEALQERLKQASRIALLDQTLHKQSRSRFILAAGIIILIVFLLLLMFNIRSKKRAYMLLNDQSLALWEQKQKLESTLENLSSAQAKLIQSEKLASLGELTAGIAHEIQNPLNFVNNFSEVNIELLDELTDELRLGNTENATELAGNIKENENKINFHGKRADSIVKGMLQHSRVSTGVKEAVDINKLADEYLRLSYHGLRAKDKSFNAEMLTDFDPNLNKVMAIPQDLGRVLLNLFTNAFYSVAEKKKIMSVKEAGKKTGYEPIIFVTTKQKADKVLIIIRDNGLGIPKKIMGKIFQPFFTTKPTGEGTGLGLSMSYEIITQAHGGELSVKTQEGEYAEFRISLPFKQE